MYKIFRCFLFGLLVSLLIAVAVPTVTFVVFVVLASFMTWPHVAYPIAISFIAVILSILKYFGEI